MSHRCHAPGCETEVPPKMFACKRHWFKLRKPTRDAIWREYRPGQENDKKPSLRYLAVQRLACAELVFRPGSESAAAHAKEYMWHALVYREQAILQGLGDPLSGLVPETPP